MSKERTTKKQQILLQYISDFIKEHGYGPSYREIMNGLEYKSVSTVAIHVDGLIARGWLRKQNHSARSLEVASSADVAAHATVNPPSVGATDVHLSAGEQIVKKLDELLLRDAGAADDVTALTESLRLLGYDTLYAKYSEKRDRYRQNTL